MHFNPCHQLAMSILITISQIHYYNPASTMPMITYDSGANGHYLCEVDRINAGLPIPKPSMKCIGVTNGNTSQACHVSHLPFSQLSPITVYTDSFPDFPQPLMSVGKMCGDGNISIFTQDSVFVHAEWDVLITCKGEPLLIGT
jgi:hypothetical protein